MPFRSLDGINLDFVYSTLDSCISCNHVFLTKSLPAKILCKLILLHLEEQRTDFEYREFKLDRKLFFRPESSNFEVRLMRLMELMRDRVPAFRFERVGRGKFAFEYVGNGIINMRVQELYDSMGNPPQAGVRKM